jgi:protein-L-isoaspartate(D-aspartate) O-methyltransferase
VHPRARPDGLVGLCWDEDQPVDPNALAGVIDRPRTEAWPGVTVGGQEPLTGSGCA